MHAAAYALVAALAFAGAGCAGVQRVPGPEFRSDDWAAAVAHAKDAGRPVFIDAWAPWCHTCLSMKSFVLSDPSLQPYYDRFVWFALDVDAPTSAEFLARYPVGSLPTFLVLDPTSGDVLGRWLGAMTIAELRQFLDDSALQKTGDAHLVMLRGAHQLLLAGEIQKAREQYRTLLERVAPTWPRRLETVVAALDASNREASLTATLTCVELAERELSWVTQQTSPQAGDFVAYANDCAEKLPAEYAARVRTLREALVGHLVKLVDDRSGRLSVDDRGDALGLLYALYQQLGRMDLLKPTAQKRQQLLETAAAATNDPQIQSTFDWARAETALWLDEGDRAITMLVQREKQLPQDYNPAHRQARVYLKLGKLDQALAASDRAIAKAYGPRRVDVMLLRAEILEKRGAVPAARDALIATQTAIEKLPLSQQKARQLAAVAERLKRLSSTVIH